MVLKFSTMIHSHLDLNIEPQMRCQIIEVMDKKKYVEHVLDLVTHITPYIIFFRFNPTPRELQLPQQCVLVMTAVSITLHMCCRSPSQQEAGK